MSHRRRTHGARERSLVAAAWGWLLLLPPMAGCLTSEDGGGAGWWDATEDEARIPPDCEGDVYRSAIETKYPFSSEELYDLQGALPGTGFELLAGLGATQETFLAFRVPSGIDVYVTSERKIYAASRCPLDSVERLRALAGALLGVVGLHVQDLYDPWDDPPALLADMVAAPRPSTRMAPPATSACG